MTRDRAYRATLYRAADLRVRIGSRSAAADAWLATHRAPAGCFLTAWNPLSRLMPARWNARAMAALHRALRGVAFEPGEGASGRWREEMVFVAIPARASLRLARRFRQAAIVVVPRGRPARLVYSGFTLAVVRPKPLPPPLRGRSIPNFAGHDSRPAGPRPRMRPAGSPAQPSRRRRCPAIEGTQTRYRIPLIGHDRRDLVSHPGCFERG